MIPHGRGESFELVRKLLLQRKGKRYVEIGCTRQFEDRGDGYSTPFFAEVARDTESTLESVDISEQNCVTARLVLSKYRLSAFIYQSDGVEFLQGYKGLIDFLYLDAWDYDGNPYSGQKHLEAFKTAEPKLAPNALILIDDIHDRETYRGKGELLIPYMLKHSYKCLYRGYQFLFENAIEPSL